MAITGTFGSFGFCFLVFVLLIPTSLIAKKRTGVDIIEQIDDVKEFKKLLRTSTNVLVIFAKSEKAASKNMGIYGDVAEEMKGKATVAFVDCSEAKKLCKKYKAAPSGVELKHYKDGEFNKDYDRLNTAKSLVNFLLDPTGDIPWEEESTSGDVVHIDSLQGFGKLLKKEKTPLLVMFYAPWCGFCKKIKPDFSAAATELKGHSVLVGVDVDKPHMMPLREAYNITHFPTIYYFKNGEMKLKYESDKDKESIVSWMKNPTAAKPPKKEETWADEENEVEHLTDDNFETFISENPSVLVMFYAPWCGHCKKMKPEYDVAAIQLKSDRSVNGVLAALDATEHKKAAEKHGIKGFPSVKYFKDGKVEFDFNERTADKIVEFMKDPKEPPPPPPPEPQWEEIESDVFHLDDETFKTALKKKKHTLGMFYAPWCGHCKAAKPHFTEAAAKFADDSKVMFAALDCTKYAAACTTLDVKGYPTFIYFNYGKNAQKYTGGREEPDFVHFMTDPLNPSSSTPPKPPAEDDWTNVEGAEKLHHLTDSNFEEFMSTHTSVLVMFYAPWCGHCKAMKPAYGEAAGLLEAGNVDAALATVDATVNPEVSKQYGVTGYPTIKYFKDGKLAFEYNRGRQAGDIVSFMMKPMEEAPATQKTEEAETKWSDEKSEVNHLTKDTFDVVLPTKEHALVMFYAPWCGHCKRAKPELTAAAEELKDDPKRIIAAIDCTSEKEICSKFEVKGYPTFKYFRSGQMANPYAGGRTKDDFLKYLKNKQTGTKNKDEL